MKIISVKQAGMVSGGVAPALVYAAAYLAPKIVVAWKVRKVYKAAKKLDKAIN